MPNKTRRSCTHPQGQRQGAERLGWTRLRRPPAALSRECRPNGRGSPTGSPWSAARWLGWQPRLGLATAAIGLTVGVLTKMVTKTLDSRALSGNRTGNAGGVRRGYPDLPPGHRRDQRERPKPLMQSVLRLTRSIGEAGTGNKGYQESLSSALACRTKTWQTMSPEDALKAVTGAINELPERLPTAPAVKAALLGRGYAGMGGFANLTTVRRWRNSLASVADNAVVMGGDAVTNVDEYDATMREMRDIMGKVAITVGTEAHPQDHRLDYVHH